jgi:hypothetical protein
MSAASEPANDSTLTSKGDAMAAPAKPRVAGDAAAATAPRAESSDWGKQTRLSGLRRFAFAITALNVAGHTVLGFETSWAHPLAALATGYSLELLLEFVDARATRRPVRYRGEGFQGLVDFLLSAHISSLAVSMLLYPNEALSPVIFATALAICSKVVLRLKIDGRPRHFMNPSNLGIATVLALFPWVGIAAPYQFTENLMGWGNWVFPAVLICLGTLINHLYTHRIWLITAWLLGFAAQAVLRHLLLGSALLPSLAPMSGLAFLLFTFYMVTDPPTTPSSRRGQIAFGLSVAATYGLLMAFHVVFGLFFSLIIVCALRGGWLVFSSLVRDPSVRVGEAPSSAAQGAPAASGRAPAASGGLPVATPGTSATPNLDA